MAGLTSCMAQLEMLDIVMQRRPFACLIQYFFLQFVRIAILAVRVAMIGVSALHGPGQSIQATQQRTKQQGGCVAARDAQRVCSDLMEVVRDLEKLALTCLDRGEPERARTIMEVSLCYTN